MDREQIKKILHDIKQESFTEDYRDSATDEEAMGLLISKYFEWDGVSVLDSAFFALEDSNFHREAEAVSELAKVYKDGI